MTCPRYYICQHKPGNERICLYNTQEDWELCEIYKLSAELETVKADIKIIIQSFEDKTKENAELKQKLTEMKFLYDHIKSGGEI
jgi:hypothetical protein